MVEFNEDTKAKALKYAENLAPKGGTKMQEALDLSLELLGKSKRLQMVLFATDGLPTLGERDPDAILRNVTKKNTEHVRMFIFGEGFDVNTKLLDFLALNHRGEADYILPEEDIGKKISGFFDRVGSPIMTDVTIQFDGVEVKDVYPKQIDDIFRGEQVILYGRYTGYGNKTVTVTGNVGGSQKSFTYQLDFPEMTEDDKGSFVPRLWAGKKVDSLLSEIRKTEKPAKELVEEVTYLAKRYGIVTPYTAYLMTDNIAGKDQAEMTQQFNRGLQLQGGFRVPQAAAPGNGFGGGGRQGGQQANLEKAPANGPALREAQVRAAKALGEARRAKSESGAADAFYESADRELKLSGKKDGKNAMHAIRYIGSRTFYQSAGIWYDSDFNSEKDKPAKTVKVGSEEYLKLIQSDKRIVKYLALGNVIIKIQGQWHRFES